jgi:hypothetical protein
VSLAEKYKDSEFLHVDIEPNTTPNFTEEENIIIGKALSRIDLRYTKDANEAISDVLLDVLKRQQFL